MYLKRVLLLLAASVLACGQMTIEQMVADFTSLIQFYVRQLAEVNPATTALKGLGQIVPLYNPPVGLRLRLGGAPSFSPSNTTLALVQVRAEITALQNLTDALVIDEMHNPG